MPTSPCDICGKEFITMGGLKRHKGRKIPCKKPKRLIDNIVHKTLAEAALSHLEVPTDQFRSHSVKLNKTLTKDERSEQGIFFTPKKARDALFSKLTDLGVNPTIILEPSFGSGEFLLDAKLKYPSAELLGVEKNETLYKSVQCPGAKLILSDFLDYSGQADLIIGNPPYFVIPTDSMTGSEKKEFAKKNAVCMTGRPNIYIRFLYKCLAEHLTADGFLAFILPTSLFNCSYYQPMRDYIRAHFTIHWLENLNKPGFYETGQETMLIVLQKKKIHDNYFFKAGGNYFITPFYKELADLVVGTSTLVELGLRAKTGNVVWNQVKDKLSTSGTLLIYSMNISNSKLTIGNLKGEKKQYVTGLEKPKISGPVILVERGYGNSLSFNAVLVTEKEFYAENHINVIYPEWGHANLNRVLKSFQDERSLQFIRWFSGNGMISATDLEKIVPIFS